MSHTESGMTRLYQSLFTTRSGQWINSMIFPFQQFTSYLTQQKKIFLQNVMAPFSSDPLRSSPASACGEVWRLETLAKYWYWGFRYFYHVCSFHAINYHIALRSQSSHILHGVLVNPNNWTAMIIVDIETHSIFWGVPPFMETPCYCALAILRTFRLSSPNKWEPNLSPLNGHSLVIG